MEVKFHFTLTDSSPLEVRICGLEAVHYISQPRKECRARAGGPADNEGPGGKALFHARRVMVNELD
jgi:hypothetical protein